MGKRKVEDYISVSPKADVIEVPRWEIDGEEASENEIRLESDTNPTLDETSLSSEEPSQSEGSRISNQLDMPIGLVSDEGVAATERVTGVGEEAMEVDREPMTFWQVLELAGYELW